MKKLLLIAFVAFCMCVSPAFAFLQTGSESDFVFGVSNYSQNPTSGSGLVLLNHTACFGHPASVDCLEVNASCYPDENCCLSAGCEFNYSDSNCYGTSSTFDCNHMSGCWMNVTGCQAESGYIQTVSGGGDTAVFGTTENVSLPYEAKIYFVSFGSGMDVFGSLGSHGDLWISNKTSFIDHNDFDNSLKIFVAPSNDNSVGMSVKLSNGTQWNCQDDGVMNETSAPFSFAPPFWESIVRNETHYTMSFYNDTLDFSCSIEASLVRDSNYSDYALLGEGSPEYWDSNAIYQNFSVATFPPVSHVLTLCGNVTESGLWIVGSDLMLLLNNTPCIDVQASDVVLDCQGHLLNATSENGTGVYFESGLSNVTAINCVFAPFWVDNLVIHAFGYDVLLNNSVGASLHNNSFNSTSHGVYQIYVSNVTSYDFDGNYWGTIFHEGYSDLCSADNGICTSAFDIFGDGLYFDNFPLSNNLLQVAQGNFGKLLVILGQGIGGLLGGIQDPLFNFLLLIAIAVAFATVFFGAIAMAIRAGLQKA